MTAEEKENVTKALVVIADFRTEFCNYLPDESSQRWNCRLLREFVVIVDRYVKMIHEIASGADAERITEMFHVFEEQLLRTESIATNYLCASFAYDRYLIPIRLALEKE